VEIEVINGRGAGVDRCPPSLERWLDYLKANTKPGQVWRQADLRGQVGVSTRMVNDLHTYALAQPYTCKVTSGKGLDLVVNERIWGLPETIAEFLRSKQGRRP